MKTEEIALSRLVENEENPRLITAAQFQKLLQSIIVFPRMLTLRPIVVDETFKALGGNMRLKALRHIASMDERGINRKLDDEGERLSDEQRSALLAYWQDWQQHPTVTIVKADDLTERQKAEFIAKDNISYGAWDYDQLANHWDEHLLQAWGMPIWTEQPQSEPTNTTTGDSGTSGTSSETGEQDEKPAPPEGRIEIHFAREHAMALGSLLGVGELDRVVYRFEDLPINKEGGEQ